ncbi:hypothetical protein JOM56_001649 [Amanita muscaria]
MAPYICKTCLKSFRCEHSVISHCKAQGHARLWRLRQLNPRCHLCHKSFIDEVTLSQHICFPTTRPARPKISRANHVCTICAKKFKRPQDLAKHTASPVHRQTGAPSLTGLSQHVTLSYQQLSLNCGHNTAAGAEYSPDTPSFQCHVCFKTFHSLQSLEAHLDSPLNDGNEFKCSKCNSHSELISKGTSPTSPHKFPVYRRFKLLRSTFGIVGGLNDRLTPFALLEEVICIPGLELYE